MRYLHVKIPFCTWQLMQGLANHVCLVGVEQMKKTVRLMKDCFPESLPLLFPRHFPGGVTDRRGRLSRACKKCFLHLSFGNLTLCVNRSIPQTIRPSFWASSWCCWIFQNFIQMLRCLQGGNMITRWWCFWPMPDPTLPSLSEPDDATQSSRSQAGSTRWCHTN